MSAAAEPEAEHEAGAIVGGSKEGGGEEKPPPKRAERIAAEAELASVLADTPWGLLKLAAPSLALCALGVIFGCYTMAKRAGHLPAGCTTPPISFMGYRTPEYWLYSGGFGGVAVGFAVMTQPVKKYFRLVAKTATLAEREAGRGMQTTLLLVCP
eukprot:SAG22_NODE_327_length_12278_cov_10.550209_12_plen_155_part_00